MTTAPHHLRNPEICVNLWAYADEGGYVARIAARAYVLDGSDEEKFALLRQLASTDFLQAEWVGVSKRFTVVGSDGERLEGVAHASMLNDGATPGVLFGPLFDKIEAQIPEQLKMTPDGYEPFKLKLSQDPLTVTTLVIEYEDGRLVPMIAVCIPGSGH